VLGDKAKSSRRLRAYVRALSSDGELGEFLSAVGQVGAAYLFGGAARDVFFRDKSFVYDLDMFVSGPISEETVLRFGKNVSRNNFGGYRFNIGEWSIDIWELAKSAAFRLDTFLYPNVDRLLKSVCFSSDAIAVRIDTGEIFAGAEFKRTYDTRVLEFVVPPREIELLVAARIARLVLKLNVEPTASVASYFIRALEMYGEDQLIHAETRWGRRAIVDPLKIAQIHTDIGNAIDRASRALK